MNTAPNAKTYLGDAVYAAHDGYHIVLTTEDGIRTTNTIYLEPPVWAALQRVVASWSPCDADPTYDGPR